MRSIDANMQAKLDAGATTLCRCWLISRKDGITHGFTNHDRDVQFDGHVFLAGSGMDASALESSTGLSVDNAQAVGALTSTGLTEADIQAGRFDGAKVENWLVDWDVPQERVLLFSGTIGEITRGDQAFEVELRGLSEDLNKPVGRRYAAHCDRVLGDAKCGFDLLTPGYTITAVVDMVENRRKFCISSAIGVADEWFTHGTVVWTSGANAGSASEIKFDRINGTLRVIELWQDLPFEISAGDTCDLVAGCDKSASMCKGKFLNFINFRGFPHIPGEDWAQAYPANGDQHDGSSQNR